MTERDAVWFGVGCVMGVAAWWCWYVLPLRVRGWLRERRQAHPEEVE